MTKSSSLPEPTIARHTAPCNGKKNPALNYKQTKHNESQSEFLHSLDSLIKLAQGFKGEKIPVAADFFIYQRCWGIEKIYRRLCEISMARNKKIGSRASAR